MNQYTLSFRIDFFPEWCGYDEFRNDDPRDAERSLLKMDVERQELRRIYHSLGLKLYSNAWADMTFDESSAKRLYVLLEDLEQKRIGFLGKGYLLDNLAPELDEASEWFVLFPPYADNENLDDRAPYMTCKACNFSPLLHMQNPHFVSEKFREVVERNSLTGLDFLWIKDLGKYKAQQWYCAIASEALGHGLDHPWFDRDKRLKEVSSNEYLPSPQSAQGASSFDRLYFKDDWTTGFESMDSVISLFPQKKFALTFGSTSRVQRKYLPTTDFAYLWTRGDGFFGNGSIHLCCNNRTRQILLENNLLRKEHIKGIIILDEVPQGVTDLDADAPKPPRAISREELERLRKEEHRFIQEFASKEKPVRMPDLKRSLKLLQTARKSRPADFRPGKTSDKCSAILSDFSCQLPGRWLEVLKIANGGNFGAGEDADCEILPIEQLQQHHDEMVSLRREESDDYSGGYIYFGGTACGDQYAFEKEETASCDDCPVVLISHEDFSTLRQWSCIADFLESVLTDS